MTDYNERQIQLYSVKLPYTVSNSFFIDLERVTVLSVRISLCGRHGAGHQDTRIPGWVNWTLTGSDIWGTWPMSREEGSSGFTLVSA